MELKRRHFMKLLLAASAAVGAGAWFFLRTAPRRVIRAVRGHIYPGKVKPLDRARASRPAPWRG